MSPSVRNNATIIKANVNARVLLITKTDLSAIFNLCKFEIEYETAGSKKPFTYTRGKKLNSKW